MKLHKEGTVSIIIAFVLLGVLDAVSWVLIPNLYLNIGITTVLAIPLCLVLWFFRVPNRPYIINDDFVYAPADGKIVVIEKTNEPEYFKDERIQVSIFMSPLNVHSNKYPVSGNVTYTKYHKGKYLVAWHPKSSTENERSTIVLKTKSGQEILVRQIAGAVARRICPYSKVGDSVTQGDELGFIKFGSRVDIFLPLDANIVCELDEKSKYNITPIAQL
ncbi:MAG: phosphatidylserine decarboxylase family protein [Bacteroidales bacterium]|nr:phosphatidylserine decarboxylase family protein [Bacteroidales bacterium]